MKQSSTRFIPAVVAGLAVAIYLPQAVMRSSWSDDYPLLLDPSMEKVIADGRPVLALVNNLVFGAAGSIGGLALARALGVAGIAAIAAFLYRLMINAKWDPAVAVFTAVTAILLPPFHAFAGWASVFAFPWVFLLGLTSGHLLLRGVRNRSLATTTGAAGLLLIALLAYPPSAMACWIPLVLHLLDSPSSTRRGGLPVMVMGLVVAATGVLSLICARFVMTLTGVEADGRFTFINSPDEVADKIRWLATRPIPLAGRPFQISSPGAIEAFLTATPVIALTIVGILLLIRGSTQHRITVLGLLAICCGGTILSHVLAAENQTEFRYLAGFLIAAWIMTVAAIHELVRRSSAARWTPRHAVGVTTALLLILAGTASVAATRNVDRVFVAPARIKEAHLQSELRTFDPTQHDQIIAIFPDSPWPTRPNLGIYSTRTDLAHPWTIEANLRLLIMEEHGPTIRPRIDVGTRVPDDLLGVLVVDLRPLWSHL